MLRLGKEEVEVVHLTFTVSECGQANHNEAGGRVNTVCLRPSQARCTRGVLFFFATMKKRETPITLSPRTRHHVAITVDITSVYSFDIIVFDMCCVRAVATRQHPPQSPSRRHYDDASHGGWL